MRHCVHAKPRKGAERLRGRLERARNGRSEFTICGSKIAKSGKPVGPLTKLFSPAVVACTQRTENPPKDGRCGARAHLDIRHHRFDLLLGLGVVLAQQPGQGRGRARGAGEQNGWPRSVGSESGPRSLANERQGAGGQRRDRRGAKGAEPLRRVWRGPFDARPSPERSRGTPQLPTGTGRGLKMAPNRPSGAERRAHVTRWDWYPRCQG